MYIGIPLDCMKLDRPHQGTSGWPPDERGACARIHVYMRSVCVDLLDAAWVWLCVCVGLLCRLHGLVVMAFGLVSFGAHCFLQLSSAGLIVVLLHGCCWAYSAFSV